MRFLRLGDTGQDVLLWEYFLLGEGYSLIVDGKFDETCKAATQAWQKKNGLKDDGVVGNYSYGVAMARGFSLVVDTSKEKASPNYPPKPTHLSPLVTNTERMKVFGAFTYKHTPEPGNYEKVDIDDKWEKENIEIFDIPQLKKATGGKFTRVSFHKKAKPQMLALWAAWEKEGLLKLIKTFDGAYYPRFVRGSKTVLSNHCFGSAFDINVKWNGLGKTPALVNNEGSVRELVPLANQYGFYWGGHFTRLDGMHLEICKII